MAVLYACPTCKGVADACTCPSSLHSPGPVERDLHSDCLCERCRLERRRRLGDEAARVEETKILELAKAIFGNSRLPGQR